MHPYRSSGDAIADRRFFYAMQYKAGGDIAAAIDLVVQLLGRTPGWAAGWFALGDLYESAGEREAAAASYRKAVAIDQSDEVGAKARLARLGFESAEDALAKAHVAALFDSYAPRFERSLIEGLAYRGPQVLREALDAVIFNRQFRHAIDLGCGTGLSGIAFKDLCDRLDGVDLSTEMLARAQPKGIYATLAKGDAVSFLNAHPAASIDLILAVDVLVYSGDLEPLFRAVSRALEPGGLFLFSVQRLDGERNRARFSFGSDLRYAHSPDGVRGWSVETGLRTLKLEDASTRFDAGHPVPGLVAMLQKPFILPEGSPF